MAEAPYDAGWADHAVPDLQGCLRVHADMLIWRAPTQAGQLTLAFKRGVATLEGGSTVPPLMLRVPIIIMMKDTQPMHRWVLPQSSVGGHRVTCSRARVLA